MLLVKTKIGPSPIAGIGIFADQFIPKGATIWEFKEGFDMRYDSDYPSTLSESARAQFLNYSYKNPATNKYVLCADDARFFNHSDTPTATDLYFDNPTTGGEGITIAARDIEIGEEITSDYRAFDGDARRHLGF